MKLILTLLGILIPVISVAAMQSTDAIMEKDVFNMTGNTATAGSEQLQSSVGEMAIGQFNGEGMIQAGFFNDFVLPVPTATPTATITPTLVPTATPMAGFDGKLISKNYVYCAPNPSRGSIMNFVVHTAQACDIDVKMYTSTHKFVLSFEMASNQMEKITHHLYVGNLANGVYFMLVEARNKEGVEERLIKKVALIK